MKPTSVSTGNQNKQTREDWGWGSYLNHSLLGGRFQRSNAKLKPNPTGSLTCSHASSRLLVFTLRIGWQRCKLLFCSLVWTWGQYVSGLWWWPPLRLSKRRSPLPTAVLLRTTLTRTIRLQNHFARIGICDPFGFGLSTLQWKLIYH